MLFEKLINSFKDSSMNETNDERCTALIDEARRGQIGLLTLIEHLSNRSWNNHAQFIFDDDQRYVQLKNRHLLFEKVQENIAKPIERKRTSASSILQQRLTTGSDKNIK
jgi:hypothetical protein